MKWAGFARPFESNPGAPQKREAFVWGAFAPPGASDFCSETKVTKSQLRGGAPKNPENWVGVKNIAKFSCLADSFSPGEALY